MKFIFALILSASAAPELRQTIKYTSPFQKFTVERTASRFVFTDQKQTVSFQVRPCNKAVLNEFWTELEQTVRQFPRSRAKTATRVEMNGKGFLPFGGWAQRKLISTSKHVLHLQLKEAHACLDRLS